ncbi:hypothetical protein NDU88_001244 [Pleurodeles waltl]|uniref:Uncharacterized protein n=1 Tax=Pleurodeles waltl TaxID=8319 RepID=A0AAV7VVW6_PLEWA|nr:hypothetical protein NDU88_001244 [Pleurodeles waltl]
MSQRPKGLNNSQCLEQMEHKVSQLQEKSLQDLQSLYNHVQEYLEVIQESASEEMKEKEEVCSEESLATVRQSQKELPNSRKDDHRVPLGQKTKGLKEQPGFKHQDKEKPQDLQSHPHNVLQ